MQTLIQLNSNTIVSKWDGFAEVKMIFAIRGIPFVAVFLFDLTLSFHAGCFCWFGWCIFYSKIAKITLNRHRSLFLLKSAHNLTVVHKSIVSIFRNSGRWLNQRPQFLGLFFFNSAVSHSKHYDQCKAAAKFHLIDAPDKMFLKAK